MTGSTWSARTTRRASYHSATARPGAPSRRSSYWTWRRRCRGTTACYYQDWQGTPTPWDTPSPLVSQTTSPLPTTSTKAKVSQVITSDDVRNFEFTLRFSYNEKDNWLFIWAVILSVVVSGLLVVSRVFVGWIGDKNLIPVRLLCFEMLAGANKIEINKTYVWILF